MTREKAILSLVFVIIVSVVAIAFYFRPELFWQILITSIIGLITIAIALDKRESDWRKDVEEKSRHSLNIRIEETQKQQRYPNDPLDFWFVRFLVSNGSDEQIFFSDLYIKLGFLPWRPSSCEVLWNFLTDGPLEPIVGIEFRLDEQQIGAFRNLPCVPILAIDQSQEDKSDKCAYLVNWISKQPIQLAQLNRYVVEPHAKEIWALYGEPSFKLKDSFLKRGLYLATIECHFHSDQGKRTVSGTFATSQGVSEHLQLELGQIAKSISSI